MSETLQTFLRHEDARLDRHFRQVLTRLRRSPPSGLGRVQRRARAKHVDQLERYRRRGRFPRNRFFAGAIPIFIDDVGTRCAMGHLIEHGQGADLVHHVADARNYDRVHDLAEIDALQIWLERNGLTVEEAALIQPAYCAAPASCFCETVFTTVLEGDVVDADNVLVTAVHGDTSVAMVGETYSILKIGKGAPVNAQVVGPFVADATAEAIVVYGVLDSDGLAQSDACLPGLSGVPSPPDVLVDALLSANPEACASVLGDYEGSWLQENTGPECDVQTSSGGGGGSGGAGGTTVDPGATSDSSCAINSGGTGSTGAAFVLLAGACCLWHRRLRSR